MSETTIKIKLTVKAVERLIAGKNISFMREGYSIIISMEETK